MPNVHSTSTKTSKGSGTRVIAAHQITPGDRLYDPVMAHGMQVRRVMTCGDGSLRIVTDLGEQRMTGSVGMRVLN